MRRPLVPRVDDMLESPSPASDDHPIELGALPPPDSSSEVKPGDPPGPPVNLSVKGPDPKPNPDNTESSEGSQRRTIRGWFRTMTKRSRNRTPRQMPLEDHAQTSTPLTQAPPSNKKISTVSYGQRIRVSVSFLRVGEAKNLIVCLSGL